MCAGNIPSCHPGSNAKSLSCFHLYICNTNVAKSDLKGKLNKNNNSEYKVEYSLNVSTITFAKRKRKKVGKLS